MRVLLFSIFDRKANIYLAPFVARSETDAVRQVSASFRDPQMRDTPVGQHPEDFDLRFIGVFDDETGRVEGESPRNVSSLLDLAPKAPPSTVAP